MLLAKEPIRIHPLSIEAISPTCALDRGHNHFIFCIHPLSIEAISPTGKTSDELGCAIEYPSSVNRGYFSYFWWRTAYPC